MLLQSFVNTGPHDLRTQSNTQLNEGCPSVLWFVFEQKLDAVAMPCMASSRLDERRGLSLARVDKPYSHPLLWTSLTVLGLTTWPPWARLQRKPGVFILHLALGRIPVLCAYSGILLVAYASGVIGFRDTVSARKPPNGVVFSQSGRPRPLQAER